MMMTLRPRTAGHALHEASSSPRVRLAAHRVMFDTIICLAGECAQWEDRSQGLT
jgi:hypothetical protein